MRWAGLALVIALLVLGWLGYDRPELFPGGFGARMPELVWLAMALLLVSGAGYGFWRFRFDTRRAVLGVLFWTGLIAAIVLAYEAFN